MTYYFGTDLANRVMQEDITGMLEPAMNEFENVLREIKSIYLLGSYGNIEEQEKRKFWSAVYAMTIDNLEYLINEVDKNWGVSGVTKADEND